MLLNGKNARKVRDECKSYSLVEKEMQKRSDCSHRLSP